MFSIFREAGWDTRLVNESYQWVERLVAFQPPMQAWQSAVRDGLVQVGVLPYNGFTYDHIYGTKVGGTIFDLEGHRHTAADLLQYANPTGLTVLLHATVHKILFRTKGLCLFSLLLFIRLIFSIFRKMIKDTAYQEPHHSCKLRF